MKIYADALLGVLYVQTEEIHATRSIDDLDDVYSLDQANACGHVYDVSSLSLQKLIHKMYKINRLPNFGGVL